MLNPSVCFECCMKNSVYFEKGEKDDVAIVLSCPGREERDANPPGPAKGQTGKNLEHIFSILTEQHGVHGLSRTAVTITNAWPEVIFRAASKGKTEPSLSQVLEQNNLDRLHADLMDIKKYIICCGDNAREAILKLKAQKRIRYEVKIIYTCHIGNVSINTKIHHDKNGQALPVYKMKSEMPPHENRTIKEIQHDNRILRLEVVAKRLFEQLQAYP